jgi:hypothetical protein
MLHLLTHVAAQHLAQQAQTVSTTIPLSDGLAIDLLGVVLQLCWSSLRRSS